MAVEISEIWTDPSPPRQEDGKGVSARRGVEARRVEIPPIEIEFERLFQGLVAAVALAFGALQVGGQAIQTNPGVSPAVATILQGLVLFGAIGAAVFSTYRLRLVDRQVAES